MVFHTGRTESSIEKALQTEAHPADCGLGRLSERQRGNAYDASCRTIGDSGETDTGIFSYIAAFVRHLTP